jgi:hypothetical protein
MAGLGDSEERALWRQWATTQRGTESLAPDALALAAYAEGRLSEAEAEPIERWLAAHPESLNQVFADIAAARGASDAVMPLVNAAIMAKARALIPGSIDNVVPLRRPTPAWRNALAWSSIAASLIAASFVGFTMGSDAYQHIARADAAEAAATDSLDATATLDSAFGDEAGSGT